MNFRPGTRDEPEINLIPFIDILLVVLIFLMLTTTYSKFTQLQVNLPVADAQTQRSMPKEVVVAVSSDGRYAINQQLLEGASVDALTRALLILVTGFSVWLVASVVEPAWATLAVFLVMGLALAAGLLTQLRATRGWRPLGRQWMRIAIGLVLFVLAFIFASVIFAVAATLALLVWGWLMWRTRGLRREARKAQGTVIEGEYRVERETRRIDDDVR